MTTNCERRLLWQRSRLRNLRQIKDCFQETRQAPANTALLTAMHRLPSIVKCIETKFTRVRDWILLLRQSTETPRVFHVWSRGGVTAIYTETRCPWQQHAVRITPSGGFRSSRRRPRCPDLGSRPCRAGRGASCNTRGRCHHVGRSRGFPLTRNPPPD